MNFERRTEKQSNSEEQVRAVDIKPEKLKTEVPTFIAHGWGVTGKIFNDVANNLAEHNRRVIFLDTAHGIDTREKHEGVPEEEMRKIDAMIKVLNEKGIEKVDVVAHSEAGFNMVLAAKLYPERFRNLVLIDPAGIIGEDRFSRLALGAAYDTAIQTKRAIMEPSLKRPAANIKKEVLKTILKTPFQTLKEVIAIAKSDTKEIIKEIRAMGIGVSIIHTVDDKFFPMEKVQNTFTRENKEEETMLDGFYSAKGTHNEILLRPKEYSDLVDVALDDLEKKMERKSNN